MPRSAWTFLRCLTFCARAKWWLESFAIVNCWKQERPRAMRCYRACPVQSSFISPGTPSIHRGKNGILISDALLTPSSLKASNFSQMRLAVLSACDTQDGPSGAFNDVDSLARVFLRAGVPNVVASRWSVDSEATRQFMELFYRNLLDGNSVAASVHQAQAALRSRPGTAHPYFWSAFSALGMS